MSDTDPYRERIHRRLQQELSIQKLLLEAHLAGLEDRKRAVDADPEKHRRTLLMPDGVPHTYRAWNAGRDDRGREISWCRSCHRNRAGYFLMWREVWDPEKGEGSRARWAAQKKRKVASELCERWAIEEREASEAKEAGG